MNDDVARDAFERDRPDSPEPDLVTRSVRDDILVHEDLSLFSVRCETLQPLAGCIRSPANSSRHASFPVATRQLTDLLLLLVAIITMLRKASPAGRFRPRSNWPTSCPTKPSLDVTNGSRPRTRFADACAAIRARC